MYRLFRIALMVGALLGAALPSSALKLMSPTPNQTVRESVKISIPVADLPPEFVIPQGEVVPDKERPFITVSVGSGGSDRLVAAVSPDAGTVKNGAITFYWDSKAPYRDPQDPRNDRFLKDGRYTLTVQVYNLGKMSDSASVDIQLKNKLDRSNPAPGVRLVNRLVFGESHTYAAHAEVQVFHVVAGTGLPILGGMGMTSDFKIIQSVEDKRPEGTYLLRCRMDPEGFISSFGQKLRLFASDQPTPQLYRLVDKFGNVLTRNVFSRQGKYTIMDVLPVLDQRPVREADTWPTAFDLKIEGITRVIPLAGDSQLDSFEWQNGHECAKIISTLKGPGAISMDNGRIRSSSTQVDALVVTYFAYKTGKMLRREITLEFPAVIMPGAGQIEGAGSSGATTTPGVTRPPVYAPEPGLEEDMAAPGILVPPGGPYSGPSSSAGTQTGEPVAKKGSVQIKVVVRLEK
jgi:hypothetical protein